MRRLGKPSYLFALTFGLLCIAGIASWLLGRDRAPSYESVQVVRGSVTQEVTVTGKIEATQKRVLSFAENGIVGRILAREGERVAAGAVIATLSSGAVSAEAAAAEASLEGELARLYEIEAAKRPEDIAVSQASEATANAALARAVENLKGALARAATLADDALQSGVDPLYEQVESGQPRFGTTLYSGTTKYTIDADPMVAAKLSSDRAIADAYVTALRDLSARAEAATAGRTIEQAEFALAWLESFVAGVRDALDRLTPDSTAEQTLYDAFKTDVSSARSALSTLQKEIRAAADEYTTAASASTVAARELASAAAPARAEALAVQQAAVDAARARYAAAAARMGDRALAAPIGGIVAAIDLKEGEYVTPSHPAATLIGEGEFEVTVYIPESDISKVAEGDRARITLDAYDDLVINGTLRSLAIADTVIDGVPTYEATIALAPSDAPLRTGLTADVDILADSRESALFLPLRSVIRDDGRTYVRVVTGEGTFEEQDVVLGLRGSDGRVEIVEGLSEGDEVVLFIENGAGE